MNTFLNNNSYCEVLTKEKIINDNKLKEVLDKPSIILSHPSQISKSTLDNIFSNLKCNFFVIEDKDKYNSTITKLYDKSVILYNSQEFKKIVDKNFEKNLRNLLDSLGFLRGSKNVEVLIDVIKEIYDTSVSFYKLEDIYKKVGNDYNVKSCKIRRNVIEAVNVMNNHITKSKLHSFFHIDSNDTVPVKHCINYIDSVR